MVPMAPPSSRTSATTPLVGDKRKEVCGMPAAASPGSPSAQTVRNPPAGTTDPNGNDQANRLVHVSVRK